MTEVHCPTCGRVLVRSCPDGSFDLAPEASVTAEAAIPEDFPLAALPIPLRTEVLPLSARCLRCHPTKQGATASPPRRWWRRLWR